MDVDIIIKIGFPVHEPHQNMRQLLSKQCNGCYTDASFNVHRRQCMTNTAFEQMLTAKRELISFNNF
jgi:hypothetical protein